MTLRALASFALCGFTLACASPPPLSGDATVAGTVYHDRNGNGAKDPFERGLAGIAVSNGADVVRTDWRGRYRLPIDDDAIVFVVKPSGFRPPTDTDGLSRFFYRHKPSGSPEGLRYPGVAPTGPLPPSVDFPLTRHSEPDRFDVLLFGDPQPYSREELDWFARDIVDEVVGSDAAFGIVLGDIVGDDLSLFEPLVEILGSVGLPWYYVPGNHDMNFRATNDAHADETFERVFGPGTYAFEVGEAHFIVLDDVIYEGPLEEGNSTQNYVGGLSTDQLRFVREYLAGVPTDHLVMLAMHIPLSGESRSLGVAERADLLHVLRNHRRSFSVSAHRHTQRHDFLGAEQGWDGPEPHHHLIQGTTSGSWWLGAPDETGIPHTMMRDGTPNGHSVLHIDGSRYAIEYRVARRPMSHQMNVFLEEPVSADASGGAEVVVNVFSGSERSRVEIRIDDEAGWTALSRSPRPDPIYVELVAREAAGGPRGRRPLPPPEDSPHVWVGRLPAKLSVGFHRLQVRTTDMFGATFETQRSFQVE